MSSHAIKLFDSKGSVLVLSRGYLEDKVPYYAYILMQPSKYLEYRKINQKGGFDLKKYGEVVRFGEELEPPQLVIDEMKRKYGNSSHFEDEIKDRIERSLNQQDS